MTALTANSITIQTDPASQPRTFPVTADLAGPVVPAGLRTAGDLYLITDVRPGDHVRTTFADDGVIATCYEISIRRRPGGRVPPGYDKRPYYVAYHHDRMNAIQDWEEKGIPIPDLYHPRGNQAGIAPMPRVAGDKFIPAAPFIPPAQP